MSTIITRSGKGSPLTNNEVDANFTNLDSDKAELSGADFTGAITTTSTVDGRDVSVDGAKLDGIESGAAVNTVDSVNTQTGAVVLDTGDIVENTNLYYTEARVSSNASVTANTAKITYPPADSTKLAGIEPLADVTDTTNVTAAGAAMLTGAVFTGDVTATDFIGSLDGAVQFAGKNVSGGTISKGQVLSISGISGNTPEVILADADNLATMPAFGLAGSTALNNETVEVVTFGSLKGIQTDYTGWALGDTLYISTTAGVLTNVAPSGEASKIQNIGIVERLHSSNGTIKVGGAGRTNATPNLDNGNFFLGNASNQSVTASFNDSVTGIALPKAGGALTGAVTTTSTFDGRDVSVDGAKLDGVASGAQVNTVDSVNTQTGTVVLDTGDVAEATNLYYTDTRVSANSSVVANTAKITYPSADSSKLAGIEAGADVTDTANVTAAGAAMTTGASFTGAITTSSTFDGRDVSVDGTKLDTIATGATATGENLLINGGFDIWQRGGASQTTSGYGSDDRWTNLNIGSSKSHTQEVFALGQTDVPNNPRFYSRTAVTSVAGAGNITLKAQKIEGVRNLSGSTATLTFWAKADSVKNIATEFVQNMGTGGTPSAQTKSIGVTTYPLTAVWQKFSATIVIPSISGKSVGTNIDDSLQINFWFDAGSTYDARTNSLGNQSGTFDIANVKIEKGSVATPFESTPIAEELALCQRYFRTIKLGYNKGDIMGWVSSTNIWWVSLHYEEMRTSPAITVSGNLAVRKINTVVVAATLIANIQLSSTSFQSYGTTAASNIVVGDPVSIVGGAGGYTFLLSAEL